MLGECFWKARLGRGLLERGMAVEWIFWQKKRQVFAVAGLVSGEGEGWGSGGLGRWCSGGLLGGFGYGFRGCGVRNSRRGVVGLLLKILGGWGWFQGWFRSWKEGLCCWKVG